MEKIATSKRVELITSFGEKLKSKNIFPFPYMEVRLPMDREICEYLNESSEKVMGKVIFRTYTINGIKKQYPFLIVDIRKLIECAEELETK